MRINFLIYADDYKVSNICWALVGRLKLKFVITSRKFVEQDVGQAFAGGMEVNNTMY